ncbi:MAG: hypothetical protein E7271_08685 [Lachnospiraceae bacterium]|jgi:hypothetical protein|nr:hypothetical protein [Lachnospiraceae bacterium]
MGLTSGKCIELITHKYNTLGRYPTKSDFSAEEVAAIKSHFGPWPRALEAAGIKEPKPVTKKQLREEKRILQKRARNAERKIIKKRLAEKKGKDTNDTKNNT